MHEQGDGRPVAGPHHGLEFPQMLGAALGDSIRKQGPAPFFQSGVLHFDEHLAAFGIDRQDVNAALL